MSEGTGSDILIIGGGVIGLSVARELHKRSAGRITILERGTCGMEASHAAAGMLAPHAETTRIDLFFRFCNESNGLYPEFAAGLLEETGIDIELDREGTLYLALTDGDAVELQERFEWQRSAGLGVDRLSAEDTRKTEPFVSPDVRGSLFFPEDGQVENRKLLQALQLYAEMNGVDIRENIEVTGLVTEGRRVTGAEAAGERFSADHVVVATGAWTSLIKLGANSLPLKVKPIKGQMISFHTAKRLFHKVIYSPRGYIVPRADGRILAGATVEDAGFNKETTAGGIEFLREMAGEISQSLAGFGIHEQWTGLRPFAADGLPVIGRLGEYENLLVATAHYRNGILLAPLTGRILTEEIMGGWTSDYLDVFGPERFRATAKSI